MGGLRLRDIRVVNKSLLAMWRWKLLLEDDTLWKKDGGGMWPTCALNWWKNLVELDGRGDVKWFIEEVDRKVGDGMRTKFWLDR